ncbi:hypothetical protein G6F32_015406 [Rhizopus arrhizus]|nr:hypothetical protein G6F32_015406 [Rhizopus arrhizus]
MLSHAQQARELWLDLAAKAGFHVRANGALVLARTADEATVLEEFADTRLKQEGYRADLLSARDVAGLSTPARPCRRSRAIWRKPWA